MYILQEQIYTILYIYITSWLDDFFLQSFMNGPTINQSKNILFSCILLIHVFKIIQARTNAADLKIYLVAEHLTVLALM
jgi:hypothetical protein